MINNIINRLQNKAAKTFKTRRSVKSTLANLYIKDAIQLIEKYDFLQGSDYIGDRFFRAKLFVDLGMSIECSLKALRFSLSSDKETPYSTYKKVRKNGHDFRKLYSDVERLSNRRFTLPKVSKKYINFLNEFQVYYRYSLDFSLLRINSLNNSLPATQSSISKWNTITEFLDNPQLANELRNLAVQLHQSSLKCHTKYLSKHSILFGKRHGSYQRGLNKFISAL